SGGRVLTAEPVQKEADSAWHGGCRRCRVSDRSGHFAQGAHRSHLQITAVDLWNQMPSPSPTACHIAAHIADTDVPHRIHHVMIPAGVPSLSCGKLATGYAMTERRPV